MHWPSNPWVLGSYAVSSRATGRRSAGRWARPSAACISPANIVRSKRRGFMEGGCNRRAGRAGGPAAAWFGRASALSRYSCTGSPFAVQRAKPITIPSRSPASRRGEGASPQRLRSKRAFSCACRGTGCHARMQESSDARFRSARRTQARPPACGIRLARRCRLHGEAAQARHRQRFRAGCLGGAACADRAPAGRWRCRACAAAGARSWQPRRLARACCAAIGRPNPPAWSGAMSSPAIRSRPSSPAAPHWRKTLPAARIGCAGSRVRAALRHGTRCRGNPQRLVVFGLGKLGGGELNFSSDIDLVYAYEHEGESDGARPLAASDYFARSASNWPSCSTKSPPMASATASTCACARSAMPAGGAELRGDGAVLPARGSRLGALPWQKARPVAGDLRPANASPRCGRSCRRYLDYGALDGLRTMKAAIAAEVARKELADDIKRGPGGIREIEFLAQALQLIHGGRERRCANAACRRRCRRWWTRAMSMPKRAPRWWMPTVPARAGEPHPDARRCAGACVAGRSRATRADRRWLDTRTRPRSNANCVAVRARVACVRVRCIVGATPGRNHGDSDLVLYWRSLPDDGDAGQLASAPASRPATRCTAAFCDFARAPGVRGAVRCHACAVDRVLPALLQAAAVSSQRMPRCAVFGCLCCTLLEARQLPGPARRTAGRAAAPGRCAVAQRAAGRTAGRIRCCWTNCWTGAWPAACRIAPRCRPNARTALRGRCGSLAARAQRSAAGTDFRIAPARCALRCVVLRAAVGLAGRRGGGLRAAHRAGEMQAAHGTIAGGASPLGYGSLGGEELGFGSDLDLVFLATLPPMRSRTARARWTRRAGSPGSAEDRRPARRRHRRRTPVRGRRAPAPGWRERPCWCRA